MTTTPQGSRMALTRCRGGGMTHTSGFIMVVSRPGIRSRDFLMRPLFPQSKVVLDSTRGASPKRSGQGPGLYGLRSDSTCDGCVLFAAAFADERAKGRREEEPEAGHADHAEQHGRAE